MAGTERLGEDQLIQVESWKVPGRLDIAVSVNGATETYVCSFSGGPDSRFWLLDASMRHRLVNVLLNYEQQLLASEEPVGLRRLRLCQEVRKWIIAADEQKRDKRI